jgi:hypothetical protein
VTAAGLVCFGTCSTTSSSFNWIQASWPMAQWLQCYRLTSLKPIAGDRWSISNTLLRQASGMSKLMTFAIMILMANMVESQGTSSVCSNNVTQMIELVERIRAEVALIAQRAQLNDDNQCSK